MNNKSPNPQAGALFSEPPQLTLARRLDIRADCELQQRHHRLAEHLAQRAEPMRAEALQ
jgi:hypothetical protein